MSEKIVFEKKTVGGGGIFLLEKNSFKKFCYEKTFFKNFFLSESEKILLEKNLH